MGDILGQEIWVCDADGCIGTQLVVNIIEIVITQSQHYININTEAPLFCLLTQLERYHAMRGVQIVGKITLRLVSSSKQAAIDSEQNTFQSRYPPMLTLTCQVVD